MTTDEAPGRDHRTEGTLLDANASRGQPITDGDGVRLITELGDPSMGARSSCPVLGVACQPRRPSAAGDPARRAAFATFEQAVDPDGVLSADERAKRADNLHRAHLQQMALKSAQARRLRAQLAQLKQQAGADAEELSGEAEQGERRFTVILFPAVVVVSQEFRLARPMCFGTPRRKTGEGERVSPGEGTEMNPTILVSKRGVQEQYGIPINTQEDLHRKGQFAPQLKVGGKIYYRRSELEAWLDARTVGGHGAA